MASHRGIRSAVLIPCYNESLTIASVIAGFRAALPRAVIYIYDNNSTDGMAEIARRAGGCFLRFAAVGALGFGVDAGVLLALVGAGWASPIGARFFAFAFAVLAIFELNRRWSFEDASPRSCVEMLAAYVGVQGVGFLATSRSTPGVWRCSLRRWADRCLAWSPRPASLSRSISPARA